MKVDHALRDYYDSKRTVRMGLLFHSLWLIVVLILVAIGRVWLSFVALFMVWMYTSIVFARTDYGYNRRILDWLIGMDGPPLEAKKEALQQHFVTEESDLEDLEQ